MTDEEKAFKRAYYEANREEIRTKQLEYSRRPEVKARTRQRYQENREHRLAYANEYYYKYVKEKEMKYNKEIISKLINQKIKILINGTSYPKEMAGVITSVSDDLFVFEPFCEDPVIKNDKKEYDLKPREIKFSQVIDVSEPKYVFDIMKMQ